MMILPGLGDYSYYVRIGQDMVFPYDPPCPAVHSPDEALADFSMYLES